MELNSHEKEIQRQAIAYLGERKEVFLRRFVDAENPLRLGAGAVSLFMAGSPGAGKTEFSKRIQATFNEALRDEFTKHGITSDVGSIIRIDVDEIREFFPQYQKTDPKTSAQGNAHVIQKAANRGLDLARDYCLREGISFLHDGTFGNYATMKKLVARSLKSGRRVHVYYLYLDPVAAWEFTKAREYMEGRNIVKEKFVAQFFDSQQNVRQIKQAFDSAVFVHCVLKNPDNEVRSIELDVPDLDEFFEMQYTAGTMRTYTAEELLSRFS